MIRQRITLLALAFLACSSVGFAQKNVVVIITDDAGWADYGFMRAADPAADPGNRGAVPTPNLDRLATMGVTFTNAYTGSVCSPSRAMITTGQYGARFGYASNINSGSGPINNTNIPQGLPTESVTLWEHMQGVGYETAAVGKWHIGAHSSGGGSLGNRPEHQGVEFFQGLWSGSRNYTVGSVTGDGQLRETISDGAGGIASNTVIEGNYSGQYVTDVFGDQSADYIRNQQAGANPDPFLLYSSFTAPHTPMQATASDLAFIDSLNEPGFTGNRRVYAAMQYAMDRNVGKVLDALEDPNNDGNDADSIIEDTLIMFINDNGGDCCDSGPNSSDNGDLRNGKGSQFEGGMRVPMIVAGGGVNLAARGTVSSDLAHSIDIVPTALIGAGGGAFAPGEVIDGVNLLPYINNEVAGVAHEDLFISRFNNQQSAVRKGDWKYMYQNGTGYQLYNLSTDLDESNNVVNNQANAAVVEELHQLLASYHVQMDKPRHDNQADDTNQFDHFRFRDDALGSAAFSTSNAWANGDTGTGSVGASWRDGYANNRLTFRAKASGDYVVTNDLRAAAGLSYMTNQINLASATAALGAERTGTINGLPVLMSNNLSNGAPEINLDATDAVADRFTFNLDLDVEVYDDLTIQGNGNQEFIIGGQIREFRAGRNVTKTGTSNLTLGGGVDITGTFDVQGGKVAFLNGQVGGNVIARAGTGIVVGGNGFNEVTGPPMTAPIVMAGLEMNYDASLDLSGDTLWNDDASGQTLSFSSPAATTSVSDAMFPSLTEAYHIPTTGGATGLNNYFEGFGNSAQRSREDATFEVWFHVSDTAAGGDQVLFEAGGAGRGISFQLNDDLLSFNVNGDGSGSSFTLTDTLTTGWHQVVGVIDIVGTSDGLANDSMQLYVNNSLVGTMNNLLINDWAGGNGSGIGEFLSSLGAGGTPATYHDSVAVVRYYQDTSFGSAEVNTNWQAMQFNPGTGSVVPTMLSIDGDYTQEANSDLEIDLLDTSTHDSVVVTGAASLAGNLVVGEVAGFAPSAGDMFTILQASSRVGEFDSASLPTLTSGLMWQIQYDTVSVSLMVTLAGDYNGDGVVNAADFTVWRDNLGQSASNLTSADGDGDGMITILDYNIWRDNYGQQIPLPAQANSEVPEPTAVALGAGAVALLLVGRKTQGR